MLLQSESTSSYPSINTPLFRSAVHRQGCCSLAISTSRQHFQIWGTMLDKVAHPINPSTRETEAGLCELEPSSLVYIAIPEQPGLQSNLASPDNILRFLQTFQKPWQPPPEVLLACLTPPVMSRSVYNTAASCPNGLWGSSSFAFT